jgi:exodeoxyribonuclease V alpha subunit
VNPIDEVLGRMRMRGEIIDIDEQFARLMVRLDETGGLPLAVAAALVSAASLRGDTGIGFDELADGAVAWLGDDQPSAVAALTASSISGDGSSHTPIVVDADRACLYRFWDYERRLADSLVSRNAAISTQIDPATLRTSLDRLFPDDGGDGTDWQKTAAALAMMRQLLIVSGGPGTGKTSTMVRILALLIETQGNECRIALAAPTGKAAARMQQAVDEARGRLDAGESTREAIPGQASTIHRLLRARSRGGFRHNADNPRSHRRAGGGRGVDGGRGPDDATDGGGTERCPGDPAG